MGEVYKARDTKLDRDVAIKVLPAAVSGDPERLARFAREAKVLASLNHPNIAQIYGFQDSDGIPALIMEFIPGTTLQTPVPVETALVFGRQIAEALEAAHERGITHRDLKPANIMVTADGVVKVLDFGLAAVPGRTEASDSSNSPTLTIGATQAGVVLGTAPYMSPEQARGHAVDKRADIWSFGVVLFEMLAGRRAFAGETTSDILASVLKSDPDWSALPASAPPSIVRLLRRCLTKDRKQRLQSIGEARILLEAPSDDGAAAPAPSARTGSQKLALAIAAALLVALAALGWRDFHQPASAAPLMRFQIPIPREGRVGKLPQRFAGWPPSGVSCGRRTGPYMGALVECVGCEAAGWHRGRGELLLVP